METIYRFKTILLENENFSANSAKFATDRALKNNNFKNSFLMI
jgi:hypothetical protein